MRYAKYNIRNTKNGPRLSAVAPAKAEATSHQSRINAGSALILAVVLTSLLAIVGVLFVMMARVNKIASSGLSENKELDSAIETVIAKISDELALDVPGVSATNPDYYDYPDVNNAWLASLEPYLFDDNGTPADTSDDIYKWRQISDVTGYIRLRYDDPYDNYTYDWGKGPASSGYGQTDVQVDAEGYDEYGNHLPDYPWNRQVVLEYHSIALDKDGQLYEQWADADGDGVADSKWIELADITSSRGRPIYAAIRIIDNGGMLNVNTAYMFDPNDLDVQRIDGSSQMQINLMGLSERDQTHTPQQKIDRLWSFRAGLAPNDVSSYEQNVVWQYGNPTSGYIPFDISDELKLRNRYILNYNLMTSRIEGLWTNAYDVGPRVPLPTTKYPFSRWPDCTILGTAEPNDYDYRHISTTYNMDRIINPNGEKMVNINRADANSIYWAIKSALDPNFADVNDVAAQIAVNLRDFRDNDSNVTTFLGDTTYYGFERPCIYISELAHKSVKDLLTGETHSSYAVELHKPYFEDNDPNNWRLVIDGGLQITIDNWTGVEQFCVIAKEVLEAPLLAIDPNAAVQTGVFAFNGNDIIELQRPVNGDFVTVDSVTVPDANLASGWLQEQKKEDPVLSIERDTTPHKCIRRLWASSADLATLGTGNNYSSSDPNMIQAHPANTGFTNVGEIGMIFRKAAYSQGPNPIGPLDTEATVRINLVDPKFQQIFNYLTVFDPNNYGWPASETRVKGRININTAPWYVIAQLPWMQYTAVGDDYQRAQEIAKNGPYENIGELMRVAEMGSLNLDGVANLNTDDPKGPDLTDDDALNDFEERDLIFARISNLVTVRSDVFTAYILVRIGTDGPQKRVIAILDRSDVYLPTDRVKIVAVHPVADPR